MTMWKRGRHVGARLNAFVDKKQNNDTYVLRRGDPESGDTDVLIFIFDQVWIKISGL